MAGYVEDFRSQRPILMSDSTLIAHCAYCPENPRIFLLIWRSVNAKEDLTLTVLCGSEAIGRVVLPHSRWSAASEPTQVECDVGASGRGSGTFFFTFHNTTTADRVRSLL